MNITIAGGSGFVGHFLTHFFINQGYHVTAIGRRPEMMVKAKKNQFSYIRTDTTLEGEWQKSTRDSDVVINLTGQTILSPWTESYKNKIEESRILTTRNIVDSFSRGNPLLFFSASAVGFYGNRGELSLTESDSPGEDFLSKVAQKWESAALKAEEKNIRVTLGRFGIILGKEGGALQKMVPAFKMCMGGPLGDGNQWFPWIHLSDLANAILFIIENSAIEGPVNFTAPGVTRNRTFVSTLGKVLRRPTVAAPPKWMIRMFLGEFGETLLHSQKVVPQKLLDAGFSFQFGDIESAFNHLIYGD